MSIENRLAAKKRSQQAKAKRIRKRIAKVIGICLIPVFICLIVYLVMMNNLEKNANASSYIKENGKISARAAKNYVTMVDYKNISLNREDLLPTESEVQSKIDSTLTSNTETVATAGTAIAADSTVALTYTVTVDGAEVEDLASEGGSYKLGSAKYTEAFDTTISALVVGSSFSVDITFDADFSTESLAGKTATFAGTVDSVNVVPELTDEFVSSKLSDTMADSDYPLTAEGYRNYVANGLYENKLNNAISDYISDNTKVKSYPIFYTKAQYYVQDQNYISTMNYYNQLFGSTVYSSPMAMLGLDSDKAYDEQVKKASKANVKNALALQAIYEDAKLAAVTKEDVKAFLEEQGADYDTVIKNYGYNYIAQQVLQERTFEYVKGLVTVSGDATKMWVPDTATQSDATAE